MQSVSKKVGATIRAFREAQEVSRETLAERAGIHPNYLGAVERGETNAGIENIAKIAKALKVPLHQIFMIQGNDSLSELWALISTADSKTTELMTRLVRAVRDWKN